MYINDLVEDLKDASCGVNIGMCNVHCLLYADDIALIAASEEDLQNMLSILENWCKKWRMKVNSTKSNIGHVVYLKQVICLYIICMSLKLFPGINI